MKDKLAGVELGEGEDWTLEDQIEGNFSSLRVWTLKI